MMVQREEGRVDDRQPLDHSVSGARISLCMDAMLGSLNAHEEIPPAQPWWVLAAILAVVGLCCACRDQVEDVADSGTAPATSTRENEVVVVREKLATPLRSSVSEDVVRAGRSAREELSYLRRVLRTSGSAQLSAGRTLPCRAEESERRFPGEDLFLVDDAPWLDAVINAGLCVYGCPVCGGLPSISAVTLSEHCPRAEGSLAKAEDELRRAGF